MHLNPYRLDLLCAIAGRVTTGARPAPFQSITRVNNNYDDLVDHDAKKTMRQYAQLHTAKENSVEILKWLLICSQGHFLMLWFQKDSLGTVGFRTFREGSGSP